MSKKIKQKNLSGKITCSNGISFKSDIGFTLERKPNYSFYPFLQLLITVLASSAVIFMALSFLRPEIKYISAEPVLITIFLASVSVLLLTQQNKFFKGIGAAYLILNTIFIMAKLKESVNGMIYVAYAYTKKAKLSVPMFANMVTSSSRRDADMFFLALAFLLTLGIAIACIYRTNFPILFLCTFPVFELGAFWGWEPDTWTTAAIIICWITILSLNLINHTTRNRTSQNTFAIYKRKKTFYMTSEKIKKSFFGYASSMIIIVTVIIFLFGSLASEIVDTYRPGNIDMLRKDISNGFQNFAMELSDKTNFSSDIFPGRGKMIGGTNGGRLGLYDEISFSGTTALNVETDKPDKPMYLRGYSAASYESNCWNANKLNDSVQGVFKDNEYTALDYGWLLTTGEKNSFNISVKAVNANKDLIYAPYQTNYSQCDNVKKQKYEGMISPKDSGDKYKLSAVLPIGSSWKDIIDYAENEMSYDNADSNSYSVYDNYVRSTTDFYSTPSEITPLLDEILADAEVSGINDAADYIRDFFDENGFTYSLSPGITPSDEDFVKYFLTEQKKGYCTYYASAGVMLMRRMGYPARYVEGYIIEPSQSPESGGNIKVSDRSAHAWCEVYIEGCGWYPLEFTPGYENDNPNLTESERAAVGNEDASSASTQSTAAVSSSSNSADNSSKAAENNSSKTSSGNLSKPSTKSGTSDASSKAADSSDNSNSDSGTNAAVTDGSGSGSGTGGTNGAETNRVGAIYTASAALFILCVIAATVIRRKTRLERLNKSIYSDNCSEAIISCYKHCLQLLALAGIRCYGNETDTQSAKKIAQQLGKFEPSLVKPFIRLSEYAVTAHMSNSEMTFDDAEEAREITRSVSKTILKHLGTLKRQTAKWIHNIC